MKIPFVCRTITTRANITCDYEFELAIDFALATIIGSSLFPMAPKASITFYYCRVGLFELGKTYYFGEVTMENQNLVAEAEKVGMDTSLLLKLFAAIQQYGPAGIALVKSLIDFFKNPSPGVVTGTADIDALIKSSLQTAAIASQMKK